MAQSNVFPAIIKAEYDSSGGFPKMVQDAQNASGQIKRQFVSDFNEIGQSAGKAITSGLSANGAIDAQVSQFRQAAAEAKAYAATLSNMQRVQSALAASTGDTSAATTKYLQALNAQVIEADRAVRAADAMVATQSRLQAAYDATASTNSRLTESYRNLYVEQGRAAKIEQAQRSRGDAFNTFATGGGGSGKSAAASAEVFQALMREQDAAQEAAAALNILRSAEAGAAEGARLLAAAYQGTALEIGRTTTSARESAAVFEQAFREQEAAFEKVQRQQQEYANAANRIRGAIDPMFIAQQRFDREMVEADRLLEAGAISAREYAAAQQIARDNLQAANAAIHQQNADIDQNTKKKGQGTEADRLVVNSTRSVRQATIQAGQQFQDIAISIGSGQRASTVFAQQLPQLAFALSGVKGRVGDVASFLAGPWGVALAIGAFALGPLIDNFFKAEKGADGASRASRSFIEVLNDQTTSVDELTKATREYNAEAEKSSRTTLTNIALDARAVEGNLLVAMAKREKIKALLEEIKNESLLQTILKGGNPVQNIVIQRELRGLADAELAKQTTAISELTKATDVIRGKLATEIAKINTDPKYQLDVGFEKLRNDARASIKDMNKLGAELEKINLQEKAAQKALKPDNSSSSERDTRSRAQVLADFRRELEERGVKTISGYRTAAQQNALFRSGATPADGYKVPSRHQSYRAVDIDKTTFNEQAIYEAGQAAGIKGLRILTESGGRKHLDFTGSGKPGTVDDKAEERAARAAEKANRETERLARISDSASEAVARVNEQFDEQPRLVDQSAAAVRRLQRVLQEVNDPKNAGTPRAAEIRRDAEEGIRKAQNAVDNDFNRQTENFKARLDIQKLLLAGKVEEAAIAERLAAIEERYGTGKRLDELKRELDVAKEILATEDATAEERAAAEATIKSVGDEYSRLSTLAARIKRETTEQYQQEEAINRALEKRSEILGRYQSVITGTYGALEDLLSGGSAGDFLKSLRQQFTQLRGQNLAESIFGDSFRQLKLFTERNNPENIAVQNLVEQIDTGSTAIQELATVITDASAKIKAANDNGIGFANADAGFGAGAAAYAAQQAGSEILVTGQITKAIQNGNRLNYASFASQTAKSIVNPLLQKLDESFGVNFFSQLSGALSGALAGFARAGKVGGALGFGQGLFDTLSKNTKISEKSAASLTKISGKFGQALGGAQTGDTTAQLLRGIGIKTSRTGGQIGGAIGSFLPIPGGEIIGSIIGSVVGGLFKKTKKGSTTISNLTDDLAFTGSGKLKESTLGLGNNVKASLSNIIDQLGGTAGGFKVSIGQRGKDFVVDPTGGGRTKGSGVLKFKTEEEAARAALLDAIKDGAVAGISAGAQRLLQAGKDLDAQLQKAMKFQSVFDRLKALKDPIGAAVEALNREFSGLINIFKEAGASTQEFAQLEELYGLERAKIIKETSEALTGSLRQLIDDLQTGENGLSLRDRLSNVRAQFDPLANDIRSGKAVDYDKFAEVARNLIDIQRQISGSQTDYFDVFNEVLGLSKNALANQENVIAIGTGISSPFGSAAVPSNDNTPVVNAISAQTNSLVASLAAVQAQIAALNFGSTRLATPSGFSVGGNTYF